MGGLTLLDVSKLYDLADALQVSLRVTKKGLVRLNGKKTLTVETGEGLPLIKVSPKLIESFLDTETNSAALIFQGPGKLFFAISSDGKTGYLIFYVLKDSEFKNFFGGYTDYVEVYKGLAEAASKVYLLKSEAVGWEEVTKGT
jgi:hypothetical protein